jgi:hypothetical protein
MNGDKSYTAVSITWLGDRKGKFPDVKKAFFKGALPCEHREYRNTNSKDIVAM